MNEKELSEDKIKKLRSDLIIANHEELIEEKTNLKMQKIAIMLLTILITTCELGKTYTNEEINKIVLTIAERISIGASIMQIIEAIKSLLKIIRLENMNEMLKYENVIDKINEETKSLIK